MCDICRTIEKSLNGDNPYFVKEMKSKLIVEIDSLLKNNLT